MRGDGQGVQSPETRGPVKWRQNRNPMKPVQTHPTPSQPAEADIQKCAYYLWKEEGSPAGRDLDFWLAARERLEHRARGRPHHLPAPGHLAR